jgi:hypothetical protein
MRASIDVNSADCARSPMRRTLVLPRQLIALPCENSGFCTRHVGPLLARNSYRLPAQRVRTTPRKTSRAKLAISRERHGFARTPAKLPRKRIAGQQRARNRLGRNYFCNFWCAAHENAGRGQRCDLSATSSAALGRRADVDNSAGVGQRHMELLPALDTMDRQMITFLRHSEIGAFIQIGWFSNAAP